MTEPKPWGKYGPEVDCLAWVTWEYADPGWESIMWLADKYEGYYLAGELLSDRGGTPTHWLPLPAAPGAQS